MELVTASFERRCPFDVLWLIVSEHADRGSIHALHATCRYICSVTTPILLRRFTLQQQLWNDPDLLERCDAILSHDRARYVHSCRAASGRSPTAESLPRYIQAIRSMCNLRMLDISFTSVKKGGAENILASLARNPTFQLASFTSNTTTPPYDFLLAQPSILHLSLPNVRTDFEDRFTSVHIPLLLSIQGTLTLIESLAPNRPIREVSVSDFIPDMDMTIPIVLHDILMHPPKDIQRLVLHIGTSTGMDADSLSLRTVRSLELRGIPPLELGMWPVFLSWFPRLEHVLFTGIYFWGPGCRPSELKQYLPVGDIPLRRVVVAVSRPEVDRGWYDYARGLGNTPWELMQQGDNPTHFPRFSMGYRDPVTVDDDDLFSVLVDRLRAY